MSSSHKHPGPWWRARSDAPSVRHPFALAPRHDSQYSRTSLQTAIEEHIRNTASRNQNNRGKNYHSAIKLVSVDGKNATGEEDAFYTVTPKTVVVARRVPHPLSWRDVKYRKVQAETPVGGKSVRNEDDLIAGLSTNGTDVDQEHAGNTRSICNYCRQRGHLERSCVCAQTDGMRRKKHESTDVRAIEMALKRLPHGILRETLELVAPENVANAQFRSTDGKLWRRKVTTACGFCDYRRALPSSRLTATNNHPDCVTRCCRKPICRPCQSALNLNGSAKDSRWACCPSCLQVLDFLQHREEAPPVFEEAAEEFVYDSEGEYWDT